MMKNLGPYLAFNDAFFNRHQRLLLWLLNAPVIKVWFRRTLRITTEDCPLDDPILNITANSFLFNLRRNVSIYSKTFKDSFRGPDAKMLHRRTIAKYRQQGSFRVDIYDRNIRTHPKYGKRIYYAFRPVWWTLHFWDWLIADRMIPQLSFGFDTLTAYPDPDPETSTVDGYVGNNAGGGASWSTIRNASAGDQTNTSDSTMFFGIASFNGTNYQVRRGFFLFDTSSLPDTATISAAVLSLFGVAASAEVNTDSTTIEVVAATPASNTELALGDFDQVGTTSFCSFTLSGWDETGYNVLSYNASGIAAVNLTGVSAFATRLGRDFNDSAPTGANTVRCYTAEDATGGGGTDRDPKLVVTYTLPATFVPQITMI